MQAILEFTKGKTLLVIMHGDFEFYEQFDRVLNLAQLGTGILSAPEGQHALQPPLATMLSGSEGSR